LVVRTRSPQSGERAQRLAFLLRKMRSLTARQTCDGASEHERSWNPPANKKIQVIRLGFFIFALRDTSLLNTLSFPQNSFLPPPCRRSCRQA